MDSLNIIYLGGKQAGVISLLSSIAYGHSVKAVVTVSDMLKRVSLKLKIPVFHSVKQNEIAELLPNVDLLISVHSREIIPNSILEAVRLGGINIHPCLYKYKGKDPIGRFIKDGETKASVGIHKMTEQVDCGETLLELFVDIDREEINTIDGIYNILYPYYSLALLQYFDSIGR